MRPQNTILRSFHHRIKDGAAHYFDSNHFMGIDPLDHSHFHEIYSKNKNESIPITTSMISDNFNKD